MTQDRQLASGLGDQPLQYKHIELRESNTGVVPNVNEPELGKKVYSEDFDYMECKLVDNDNSYKLDIWPIQNWLNLDRSQLYKNDYNSIKKDPVKLDVGTKIGYDTKNTNLTTINNGTHRIVWRFYHNKNEKIEVETKTGNAGNHKTFKELNYEDGN